MTTRKWQRREYEMAAMVAARKVRVLYLFWTRRGRKSTTLGSMGFDAMSAAPGQSVISASASLLVGSELISMTLSAAEQAIRIKQESDALRASLTESSEAGGLKLETANSETGKIYSGITDDDYTDLYKSKKLEFRLYFDRSHYSRMMVIAPNPATARGWGGWVFRDEQQFTHPEMERELQTATDPIIDTDPTFRLIYASNLCGDDRHPGYEMTLPAEVQNFEPNPQGHFYISQTGIMVHRVDLADAYSAGHTLFDKKSGEPITLDTALSGMSVSARKCNYMLVHEPSGTAAINALSLHVAQSRGVGRCRFVYVDKDTDMQKAITWLCDHLVPGLPTGIGFDVATTTSGKSNPSSITVTQQAGAERISVIVIAWKTKDPKKARARMRTICETCRDLDAPAIQLCIDGSNERYFAVETQQEFESLIPVTIVENGRSVDPLPPGYETAINYKTFLGDLYSAQINDGHCILPPEEYIKKDHRQVVKERGTYNAQVDNDGGHADTFDSGKLSHFALQPVSVAGPIKVFDNTKRSRAAQARRSRVCIAA